MASKVKSMKMNNPTKQKWPTAVLYHGMNPGMVNHCMKQGLLDLAANVLKLSDVENRTAIETAMNEQNFAVLAHELGVKVVHVAERDSQVSSRPRYPGEFASTWSVDGFVQELQMYSELALGTHERTIPANATHWKEGPHSVALGTKGANTRIFSWVPSGPTLGYLTTHDEVLTMGEYLSLRDDDGNLKYRPTVLFSYMPCDLSVASIHELIMNGYEDPKEVFLDGKDITLGKDEVGVLLLGHRLGGWWTGSTMSIEDATKIVPGHSPTTIQVTSGVIGSLHWLLQNPSEGICKPEALPHDEVLAKAMPYLEPFVSIRSEFNPLDRPLMSFYDYENTFGSIKKNDWMPDDEWKWQLPVLLQGPTKLTPSPYYVPVSKKEVSNEIDSIDSISFKPSLPTQGEPNDNKVMVGDCDLDKGLFAATDLAPGEKIINFRGSKITLKQLAKRGGEDRGNPLQIGPRRYMDLESPCVYGNHSCEPNAVVQGTTLVARRIIPKGEEIRYDYSTTMAEDDWMMDCRCGSRRCRRVVLDLTCLPVGTIKQYLREDGVMPYIVEMLRDEEEAPFDVDEFLKKGGFPADEKSNDEKVHARDKLGLIADVDFLPGDQILRVKVAAKYNGDECDGMSNCDHLYEIGRDSWGVFEPPFCHIRHSCNPNAGVMRDELLVARKPIKKGEEITWDESTSMSGQDEELWGEECDCGSIRCRQIVLDFPCLPSQEKAEYIGEGIVFSHVVEANSEE